MIRAAGASYHGNLGLLDIPDRFQLLKERFTVADHRWLLLLTLKLAGKSYASFWRRI
jgi:hypothetical protein